MHHEFLADSIRTDLVNAAKDRDRLLAQVAGLPKARAKRHGAHKLVNFLLTLRHHLS